jgi:uncharacterized protein YyaL (SSP411 family)
MDETTYSDETVIQSINDQFVPVRVDNDQRPDINLRYNMGGWPTTAFLTPTGDILTGATYLPPERMRELLPQLAAHYKTNREQIHERVQEILQQRQAGARIQPAALNESIFDDVLRTVMDAYDPVYGGFDDAPKFCSSMPTNCATTPTSSTWSARPWSTWPAAASSTRSGAASSATLRIETGAFPTSKRCWRTTPAFSPITCVCIGPLVSSSPRT